MWEANFAAEQSIKSYLLQDQKATVPNTHDIEALHNLAIWEVPPPQALLDAIKLMPSGRDAVRYRYSEMTSPSLFTVIQRYEASQTICRHYTQILPRKFKLENAGFKMQAPPMPKRGEA